MSPSALAQFLTQNVKPGQSMRISKEMMEEVQRNRDPIGMMKPFTAADWVLEQITSSAYEWSYEEHPRTGDFLFSRLLKPLTDGRRTYVSPDRRAHVERRTDGFYHPIAAT